MKKYSILVVEDEAIIAASLAHTLSSLGYTVHKPVATGEAAIHAIKTKKPDLVLMDIQLIGEMDGIETAKKIRAIADIPVVYLTAHTEDQHLKQAQLTEPYGYLVKPTENRELNATIEMALYKHAIDKKLKESEEQFRTLIEVSPDAIVLSDMEGNVLIKNRMADILVGYDDGNFKAGTNIKTFFPQEELERLAKNTQIVLEQGSIHNIQYTLIRRDGTRVLVELNVSVVKDPVQGQHRFVAVVRDITERKRAEKELQESEARFRLLFNSGRDAIAVHLMGKDGQPTNFIMVNDIACERLGYTREEMLKLRPHDIDAPERSGQMPAIIEKLLTNKQVLFETEHISKNGSRIPVEVSTVLFQMDDSLATMSVARDISKRKLAAEALRQANKKLTLLSSITRHDINNKLAVLLGYLDILKNTQLDPSQIDYCQKVTTAVQRISSIIQFTKEYEKIGVNAPVWQDCRTLVDTAAREAPLGHVLVKNDLPDGAEVFVDPLIVRVFYNLMDNAVRYGGKITNIRFFVEERDGDHLIVCEDDGIGVLAEEKERIFERGFGKNTGLGLFLAREILFITGITIRETGEPGKGARFEITVPEEAWRIIKKESV